MNIAKESLAQLQCSEYRLPLSVGPVTCGSNRFCCGRCSSGDTRIEIYEVLAKNFAFPCRYQEFGCEEFVPWGSVLSHEQGCPKKPQLCPAENCTWSDAMEKIPAHFEERHVEDYIKANLIELRLCEEMRWCKLLKIDAGCFVFDAHFSMAKQLLEMNVLALADLKEADRSKYQITLHSHNFSERITLTSAVVKPLAMFNQNGNKSDNIIEMNVLKFLTNDKNVVFCEITPNVQEYHEEINRKLVKLLKCPPCKKCFKCQDCSLCYKGPTQTCSLKRSINQMYFCKNKDVGCPFIGLLEDMKLHQQACDFYRCPLQNSQNCSWNGNFEELVAHCKYSHRYKNEECDFWINLASKINGMFQLIHFDGLFFRICWMYGDGLCVAVQFVGPHKKASEYLFKWSLEARDNLHSELSMTRCCYSLSNEETAFDSSFQIPHSILTQLVEDNMFLCSVKIFKNVN